MLHWVGPALTASSSGPTRNQIEPPISTLTATDGLTWPAAGVKPLACRAESMDV